MINKPKLIVIFLLLLLTACQQNSSGESYAAMLKLYDKLYYFNAKVAEGDVELGEKIGEISKRVPPDVIPEKNFQSNYLNEGEEIYSSVEKDIVFVKRNGGRIEKFKTTE
ncbi:hypothetical protein V7654_20010 [Bacillus sp. JJ1609]|uniref:hypothetical protein n=1 Tax=Bacillus sp. JJ1609 TaxID=3122977 RepID=UPI002FFDE958